MRELLRFHRGSEPSTRILDYASGYGRSTRFVRSLLPDLRLTVADIHTEAVAFQAQQFGVEVFPAPASPRDLFAPQPFDLVTVFSLLTHVPHTTFALWIEKLLGCARDDGLLLFTVHDTATRAVPIEGDANYVFDSYAVRFDAPDGHGDTYVAQSVVTQAIAAAGAHVVAHVPLGLNRHQDIWVVSRRPPSHSRTLRFPAPPELCVDGLRTTPDKGFECGGWAADAAGPVERVRIWQNERLLGTAVTQTRDDLVAHFRNESARQCGWYFADAAPLEPGDVLVVDAITSSGARTLKHAVVSPLDG